MTSDPPSLYSRGTKDNFTPSFTELAWTKKTLNELQYTTKYCAKTQWEVCSPSESRRAGSGQRTSSTTLSFARQRGEKTLVCRIQPWQHSTAMWLQASSIACNRLLDFLWYACFGHKSSTAAQRKTIRLREGLYGGRQTFMNHWRTWTAWWKLALPAYWWSSCSHQPTYP